MIDIYIASCKRPNAILPRRLTEAGIPFTLVLDHKEDYKDYSYLECETTKIITLDKPMGIGYTRQFIKSLYRGIPLMMLDDDLSLRLRQFEDPTRLLSCKTKEDTRRFFSIVDKFCKNNKFDIGGVSHSAFNYNDVRKTRRAVNIVQQMIFNSDRCKEVDYDPNLYLRMEDTDFLLQCMKRKFEFLVCNEVLYSGPINREAKDTGGCSYVYRNNKIMQATTDYAVKKWGKYIQLKKTGNIFDYSVDFRTARKDFGYDF